MNTGNNGSQMIPPYGPYILCGWRISSDIPLPELLPWPTHTLAPSIQEPDLRITFRTGVAPEKGLRRPQPDGSFDIAVRGLASFHISPATDILSIEAAEGIDPVLLRNHLYGTVLAAICYRRNLLPLHGAAIKLGDSAVILCGDSGAGKSTLGTAFSRHGYTLLNDDVCAIDFDRPDGPLLRPAFPRVKLLPDAIDAFGLDPETTYSVAARGTKGHFGMAPAGTGAPAALPIAAIYHLLQPGEDGPLTKAMKAIEAIPFLRAQVHRRGIGKLLGHQEAVARQVFRLSGAVPCYALTRRKGLEFLSQTVDFIAAKHGQDAAAQCGPAPLQSEAVPMKL